jgi:hypothetical protein
MKDTEIIPNYEYVDDTPDLEITIELEFPFYEPEPDLHAADEVLPEHNIIKDDYYERELDNRELERQRKEYFDSINSPKLPQYKPKES